MLARTDDHWAGRRLVRMDVAALADDAPVPPGLPRVPAAGETFVSPALAELLVTTPADELGDRFGEVVGTIEPAGLMAPDELAAVVGRDAASLRAEGARVVTELDGTRQIPVPTNPMIRVLVVLALVGALAPVAVFVASATRLSAARREQRLAALRLAGRDAGAGDPARRRWRRSWRRSRARWAAWCVFFALRPLIAMVPLGQATWYPDTIVPPRVARDRPPPARPGRGRRGGRGGPAPGDGLAAGRQAPGTGGPAPASPPGSAGRVARRVRLCHRPDVRPPWVTRATACCWCSAASFFGIIVSIAIAGPWITAIVGRLLGLAARGPVPLLAGRRLADDPRGAFGAIGGVVMAVFVGSAYLSIAAFTAAATPTDERLAVRPDVLIAALPGDGSGAADAGRTISAMAGVEAVAEIREVSIEGDGTRQLGVVAACPTLVAVLSAPDLACGPGLVHLGPGGTPVTQATVQTARYLGGQGLGTSTIGEATLDVTSGDVDRYAPAGLAPEARLALPAVIIEPAAFADARAAFPTTRMAIRTDGDPATIERVRTAVQVVLPTSVVRTVSEAAADAAAIIVELGRVVSLGVIVAMLLAGASLAIAVISGLVERRTPFALLRLAGMPLARLRAVLVVEAAAPLVAVATLSAVLGTVVAQVVIRSIPTREVPPPDVGVVGPAHRRDPGRDRGRPGRDAHGRADHGRRGQPVRIACSPSVGDARSACRSPGAAP